MHRIWLTTTAALIAAGTIAGAASHAQAPAATSRAKGAPAKGAPTAPAAARPGGDAPDYEMIGKIREEGLTRSQVMDHVGWLADVYGPRLTGSPNILHASDWAIKKFTDWGLANAHREYWAF